MEKPLAEPPQYTKSAIGNIMATRGYERATFVDCDVLIAQDCEDLTLQAEPDSTFMAFDEGCRAWPTCPVRWIDGISFGELADFRSAN